MRRPGRYKRARTFGNPEIVTDAQPEIESGCRHADEFVARCVAGAFVIRREDEKMRLAIAGDEVALRIDENLRVVDDVAGALRNSAHDRERKLLRHFLQGRDRAFGPRLRVSTNDRHRVAGIRRLGKNDQLCALLFRARGEIAHLPQIRVNVTKRTGDLSSSYFHLSPRITPMYSNGFQKSVNSRPFA